MEETKLVVQHVEPGSPAGVAGVMKGKWQNLYAYYKVAQYRGIILCYEYFTL
jgi:hypothetical protein